MGLAHDLSDSVRTQDIHVSEEITFDTLLLSAPTLEGLKSSGFHKPSPVQLQGIPLGKCGFDLLLEAKSGTGKTAVFAIIALEKLDLRANTQAIILAPTREIAAQIADVVKLIGSGYDGFVVEVVMGGLSYKEDVEKFEKKKVHVVVGSPGRLRHLIHEKCIDTSAVRLLVLDEADKLMEPSFQSDINYIFASLPQRKQVIMSSATYAEDLKCFVLKYMDKSHHVCPDSTSILLGITQKVTTVKCHSNIVLQTKLRYKELLEIFTTKPFKQCLIFCNYQARVVEVCKMLQKDKWPAEQLYGKQEQIDRLDALRTLQEFKCRILVSTDLAARGIDASNVDLIINFEPPHDWATYLHRIGRAGRYGSYGMAISILTQGKEETRFKSILKILKGNLNISELWTDNAISFDDEVNVQSKQVDILDVAKHKHSSSCKKSADIKTVTAEIWNMISENNSAEDTVAENFEDLVVSFESFNKVNTFNDLMVSFENKEPDSVLDITYKILSFNTDQTISPGVLQEITNFALSKERKVQPVQFKDAEIKNIENNCDVEDAKDYTSSSENICPSDNLQHQPGSSSIVNIPANKDTTKTSGNAKKVNNCNSHIERKINQFSKESNPGKSNYIKKEPESKIYSDDNALTNHYSVAFKSKKSHGHQKHKGKMSKELKQVIQTDKADTPKSSFDSCTYTKHKIDEITSPSDCDNTNFNGYYYNRNYKNLGRNINAREQYISSNFKANTSSDCRSLNDLEFDVSRQPQSSKQKRTTNERIKSDLNVENQYKLWYTQLKNMTRQIAYSIYIDEMSKS